MWRISNLWQQSVNKWAVVGRICRSQTLVNSQKYVHMTILDKKDTLTNSTRTETWPKMTKLDVLVLANYKIIQWQTPTERQPWITTIHSTTPFTMSQSEFAAIDTSMEASSAPPPCLPEPSSRNGGDKHPEAMSNAATLSAALSSSTNGTVNDTPCEAEPATNRQSSNGTQTETPRSLPLLHGSLRKNESGSIQNAQRNKIIHQIKQAKKRQQMALRDGDLEEYTEQRGIGLSLRRSLDPDYQGFDGLDPCLWWRNQQWRASVAILEHSWYHSCNQQ